VKLLLVFVEGEHDVVWTERSLRVHRNYVEFKRPVQNFPTPLGGTGERGVLARQLVHATDQRLTTAKRPPLPRLEAALHHQKDDTLALVMQMHGLAQLDPVVAFLGNLFMLLSASKYEITACAVAMLLDADNEGVAEREAGLSRKLASVYPGLAALSHGAWQQHALGPVGVWVFHDPGTGMGSLEHCLEPVVSEALAVFWAAAASFLAGIPRDPLVALPVDRDAAARFKATLTAAGQVVKPGAAMHGMLSHDVLLGDALKASADSKALAEFLAAPRW
jgi:hypothetical protein